MLILSKVSFEVNMGSFVRELWRFLRSRKKLWLAPVIVLMLIVATLLIVAQGSVFAPLIYALF
jgi:hypothetical protein